jgi:hypothetical protein
MTRVSFLEAEWTTTIGKEGRRDGGNNLLLTSDQMDPHKMGLSCLGQEVLCSDQGLVVPWVDLEAQWGDLVA